MNKMHCDQHICLYVLFQHHHYLGLPEAEGLCCYTRSITRHSSGVLEDGMGAEKCHHCNVSEGKRTRTSELFCQKQE